MLDKSNSSIDRVTSAVGSGGHVGGHIDGHEGRMSLRARLAFVLSGAGRGQGRDDVLLGSECKRKRLDAVYELLGGIGRGQFGLVSQCRHRSTGRVLAVKTLAKSRMDSRRVRDEARREVEVMVALRGHPNVVSVEDVFEDASSVHIVMELCSGGPLTDRMAAQGEYGERAAAAILRVILQVVQHCHSLGIVHRDLKLSNFLLSDETDSATLKAIDFGTSCFIKDGERLTEMAGTPLYLAPEVLEECYGRESDIWSCGVILHTLLVGSPPFCGASVIAIFDAIKSQPLDLQSQPWPLVSEPAKDILTRMLQRDPSLRPSAAELLEHPWIQSNGAGAAEGASSALASIMLPRLKKFSHMCRLRQLALLMTARYLPEGQMEQLKGVFSAVDKDKSGQLSLVELREALQRVGAVMSEEDVKAVFEFADLDSSGKIDYPEFVAATMVTKHGEHAAAIRRAFREIDGDGSGSIEVHEFAAVCAAHNMGTRQEILALLQGALLDPDTNESKTSIDYNSFLALVLGEGETKDMSWALAAF